MSIQTSGGQPQKQPKYAPLYTGRMFQGLYTNRSPLRDGSTSHVYEKYGLGGGDVIIDGANTEITNRLTLGRRPGTPIYDTVNTWNAALSYYDFELNKGTNDVFGSVTDTIDLMIDEANTLWALTQSLSKSAVWAKSTGAGQDYMQDVGETLYFGNGVDQKKWLQTLFTRTSSSDNTVLSTDTYPLLETFFIDSNANIQQLLAGVVNTITGISVANGIVTFTLSSSIANTYANAYQFMTWGFPFSNSTCNFLEGFTVNLNSNVNASQTSITATIPQKPTQTFSATGLNAYLVDVNDVVTLTTGVFSAINWSTQIPQASNSFVGGITLDGNILWRNHAVPQTGSLTNTKATMDWGIPAPTVTPTFSVTGSETGWQASTFYSPGGYVVDAANNIWQIKVAGKTGSSNPFTSFSATSVAFPSSAVTVVTDGTVQWQCVAQSHNSAGNYSTSSSVGPYFQWLPNKSISDGQYFTSTNGSSSINGYNQNYSAGSVVIANGCVFVANRNTNPQASGPGPNVPVSVVFGGAKQIDSTVSTSQAGWSVRFYNHSNSGAVDAQSSVLGAVGQPVRISGGSPLGAATASADGVASAMWNWYSTPGNSGHAFAQHPMVNFTITGAGETTPSNFTTPWAGMPSTNFEFFQFGKIRVPVPMQITFTIISDDGFYFGIDPSANATFLSATSASNLGGVTTGTAWCGFPAMYGLNEALAAFPCQVVVNFPTAGIWGIEFDYAQKDTNNIFVVIANGDVMTPEQSTAEPLFSTGSQSSAQPAWPSWNTSQAAQNTYQSVQEGGQQNPKGEFFTQVNAAPGYAVRWLNIGPTTDFKWQANTTYTAPGTEIIDSNSNLEQAYETGFSGLTQPNPWGTSQFTLTSDTLSGGTLQWINEGPVPSNANQTAISATTGFKYGLSLVNTLDDTVSNMGPKSASTGALNGTGASVDFPAAAGLNLNLIDPQSDWVAIWRTTDGGSTFILVPGVGNPEIYTVPLCQYLLNGYVDTTPDADLDELASAPAAGENTPPLSGAINLSFHLDRIWYSIGNTIYWTTGPLAPVGNGVNGTAPSNFATVPSNVKRLVPTAIGMLVFTVADIYIIAGSGTPTNPILPAIPYEPGVGLANYNALDVNGALIGFYTTDKQFIIFDPSGGLNYAGNPIGDQLRKNNGTPGQSWNNNTVYVAWYANGEDMGWYLGDGVNGYYKLIATPSPETGETWSPFATIQTATGSTGNISAIASVKTAPGVHSLLIGPSTSNGNLCHRVLEATSDNGTTNTNGTPYLAWAAFGSYVLASPGQIAKVAFLTFDSVRVGSPLILGVLIDEALPYFTGSWDIIKRWENDPPNLPPSKSILGQRFYLAENTDDAAYCRHFQFMVQWPAEAAANELQAFAVFGAYEVEQ